MLVVTIDWKGLMSGLGATLGAAAAVSSEVLRPALLMHSLFSGVDIVLMGVHEGRVLVALLIVPVAVRRRFLRLWQWLLALPTDKAPVVLVTMLTTQRSWFWSCVGKGQ